MARLSLKYALCCVAMFLVTLAYASSDEDGIYFEYEKAPNVKESWDSHYRTGGKSQAKRAMAILNRLVMVAQRANKSQRLHRNENHYAQLYKLPPLNSPPTDVEVLNDISSLENNSEGVPTSDQKAMALPRLNFERRDQKAPRVFWRCYFNAVSCFR